MECALNCRYHVGSYKCYLKKYAKRVSFWLLSVCLILSVALSMSASSYADDGWGDIDIGKAQSSARRGAVVGAAGGAVAGAVTGGPGAAVVDATAGAIAGAVGGFINSVIEDVVGPPKDNAMPPVMIM